MTNVIRDSDFEKIADSVKPDAKKRITLHKVQMREGVTYHVYSNSIGQIILDPQVTIPASEAWLFNNPDALESVRRGLSDAAKGKASKINLDTL
ncbi:MAG: hypothetical protein ABSA18_07930 [Dehalococcoidia bacterium]|jgi:hypothetical protein